MRSNLSAVRARVERVAESVRFGDCAVCDGHPVQTKVAIVWVEHGETPREPEPWPTADLPKSCVCGRTIEYVRVVHHVSWLPTEPAGGLTLQ